MREDPFAAILPVTWMNYSSAGFIPHPRTPTIALLVEKSRLHFVAHAIRGRAVRKLCRNFLIQTGFVSRLEENPSNFERAMSPMANTRRFFRALRASARNHFSNFFSTIAHPLVFHNFR